MTNISKNPLPPEQSEQLYAQLTTLLSALDKKRAKHFLTELLGYEERVMLAKRLAIVVLLIEGESSFAIARTLHVSTSTVQNLRAKYDRGELVQLVTIIKKDTASYTNVLKIIDDILTVGGIMPHYNDKSRWKKAIR